MDQSDRRRTRPTPHRDRRGGRRTRATRTAVVFLISTAAALSGCDGILGPGEPAGPPAEITELPRALSSTETDALRASNVFGLDLLAGIVDVSPDENHFLSPLSASMALGMTMNGADGETYSAMRQALRFGSLSEDEINAAYEALVSLLAELDPSVSFHLANAIWHRDDLTPRPGFVQRAGDHFGAAVEGLDFGDPGAADVINGWVEEATNDRIEDMIEPPIPGNVVAMLLNAIYFQGDWREPFDPDDTEEAFFHGPAGETGTVDLMDRTGEIRFHGTENYAAAELPYGGGAYVMDVIVPRGDATVPAVLSALASGGWAELVAGLDGSGTSTPVRVLLPRFELEWERTLNDDLAAMGMGIAFVPGADFSRMFEDSSPWIDEVRQKSFVRVDEEGTEAAAATQVSMQDSAPPEVRADRPFLFVIRERLSGAILFAGAVVEPPESP